MKKSSGMTLLEVLIALAIFATASISAVRAVTQHINSISYLEEKTFASMVADNQMTLTMLSKSYTSTKKGSSEMAGRTWYWQTKPIKTTESYLRAIDVSVAADEQMKHPLITVRSYVLQ